MDLENIRILKEMRNTVNRKVNCEAANINKTVNAAVRQVEDIQLISRTIGFESLSDGLAQVARLTTAVSGCHTERIRYDVESAGGQIRCESPASQAE